MTLISDKAAPVPKEMINEHTDIYIYICIYDIYIYIPNLGDWLLEFYVLVTSKVIIRTGAKL